MQPVIVKLVNDLQVVTIMIHELPNPHLAGWNNGTKNKKGHTY